MQFFYLPKTSHKIKQFTLQDDKSICINTKIQEGGDQPPKAMRPEYYPICTETSGEKQWRDWLEREEPQKS